METLFIVSNENHARINIFLKNAYSKNNFRCSRQWVILFIWNPKFSRDVERFAVSFWNIFKAFKLNFQEFYS